MSEENAQSTLMETTQYSDVNELLDQLFLRIKSILGDKLVGLYLYGSLVWGDFDHDVSDIDLLAAVSSDINDREFSELKKMHEDFVVEYPEWKNRIEVQYLTLQGLKTFRTYTTKMPAISPGEPLHIVEAGKDWLMNWYFVQEYGATLFGPSPATIIDHISEEEFLAAVHEHALQWREWVAQTKSTRPFQSYAILTLCRAFYTYKHGKQVSKRQAAVWAQKQFPEWSALIQNALIWRAEARHNKVIDHEATFPETVNFVNFVIDKFDS